ncbi:MAG TPA: hypothetical protein VIL48_04180 [Acidimicrobiales bacterium]
MPKLPWAEIESVPPDTEITVMASRLPLRRYRHVPGFLAATRRIRRQLARAEGLVGYALEAQLTRKTFWTVSAWTDLDRLYRFNRSDPHRADAAAIRPRMEPSSFVFWTARAGDLPISWREVRRRLAEQAERAAPPEGDQPAERAGGATPAAPAAS